jgi:putrescine aminotransferase
MLYHAARCPVEATAQGAWVFAEDGSAYLDFAAGYGVFGVGHLDQHVQAAVQHQLVALATAPSLLYNAPAAALMRRLSGLLPGDLRRVLLAGSGSEAIEIALWTAMLARPGRTRLVAAAKSYHGKTLGALSVMGQDHLRSPFEPLWPDVRFVPYGDTSAMAAAVGRGALAVVLEPLLGGGYLIVPPDGYLAEVAQLCARTGTPLIVDEVQTGFGRTGTMFAIEREGVIPDVLVVSKGITGGHVPMAAAVVREQMIGEIGLATGLDPAGYGLGAAASSLTCAGAKAAIDVIVARDLPRRAEEVGRHLLRGLCDVVEAHPTLATDAPGRGLMAGVKLRNAMVENAVWLQLLKRGVLAGLSTNSRAEKPVLRLFPPLTVELDEVDVAVGALDEALDQLERRPALLFDLANHALRVQYHFPKLLLRGGARLLSA